MKTHPHKTCGEIARLGFLLLTFAAVSAPAAVRYVNVNNTSPAAPYLTWGTAATNIQAAADAATAGDQILVTNGVYDARARVVGGIPGTNGLAVTKAVLVQSVNGPAETTIRGFVDVRCVYLGSGAVLSGFSLTGASLNNSAELDQGEGAGAYGGTLTNCIVYNNANRLDGGGVSHCTLNRCTLSGNSTYEFGSGCAKSCTLNDCVLVGNDGGAASLCTLNNCSLTDNSGGTVDCTLNGCALTNNFSPDGQITGGISGGTANRCVLTRNGGVYQATLTLCTLTNDGPVGSSTLNNCTITAGGGVRDSALRNSFLTGYTLTAAVSCKLTNCTLIGNWVGAQDSTLYNCLVYYNEGGNYGSGCTFHRSCTTPLPEVGSANMTSEPQMADLMHISARSPCRGGGSVLYRGGTDIDGETWFNPPSIGCDELHAGAITGPLSVSIEPAYLNAATGLSVDFIGHVTGHAGANFWDFGDGTAVSNRLFVSHSWNTPGVYTVVFSASNDTYPTGVVTTLIFHVADNPVQYVALGNTNSLAPYTSWETAATNIQDAVDALFLGGRIVVSNGVYRITNTIVVSKPVTIASVNGPARTVIYGIGGVAECAALANGVALIGFTLADGAPCVGAYNLGGATLSNCTLVGSSGYAAHDCWLDHCTFSGNSNLALFCTLNSCIASNSGYAENSSLTNCTLIGRTGSYQSSLDHCVLTGRDSDAEYCTLNQCVLTNAGGAVECNLHNCVLTGSSVPIWLYDDVLDHCTLKGMPGDSQGYNTFGHCTVTGTSATLRGGFFNSALNGNSGTIAGSFYNSLLTGNSGLLSNSQFYNSTVVGSFRPALTCRFINSVLLNNSPSNYNSTCIFSNSCTIPMPTNGFGNITNAPLFVNAAGGDYRLQSNSPCINSGNTIYASFSGNTDLDDNPRVAGDRVDIGAYEYPSPSSIISYAWLQRYGLPLDGSADHADPDGDHVENWQEALAGTSPFDPASLLRIVSISSNTNGPGMIVTWQSVAGVSYFLERSTDVDGFYIKLADVLGQTNTTSYLDRQAFPDYPYFYRVGVR